MTLAGGIGWALLLLGCCGLLGLFRRTGATPTPSAVPRVPVAPASNWCAALEPFLDAALLLCDGACIVRDAGPHAEERFCNPRGQHLCDCLPIELSSEALRLVARVASEEGEARCTHGAAAGWSLAAVAVGGGRTLVLFRKGGAA